MPSGPARRRCSPSSRRATARCSTSATRCSARSTAGTWSAPGGRSTAPNIRPSCARSAIWCPSRRPSASPRRASMPSWRPWPGRSWSCRCSMPASCSMPPTRAGAASMMRSTAPMRFPDRPAPAAMTRRVARRSSAGRRASSIPMCRSRTAAGMTGSGPSSSCAIRASSPGAGRAGCCSGITACTSRSSSIRLIRSARPIRAASATSSWKRRSPPSWILRIRSRRSMRRTRSRPIATGWA